ncbi:MAG: hypothetical protein BMS9Abin08_1093 [Gammaproteobacteria bacterium]|nr:MAG: hypothetical protein BMS9Abin08_1093 [Gammaproteobacteria bacterium]
MKPVTGQSQMREDHISLFLCGDVMTGRGVDQALPHPGDPQLYEPLQIKRFRLNRATGKDVQRPKKVLDRESRKWGARIEMKDGHALVLRFTN